MKQFKKRTIALVLASVITVVGAFGAENYKNSLMSLKFEGVSNGAVNMTVFTKRNYDSVINPVKKDANTYVIMLPETNSKMLSSPELGGNIESVDVKTMPYTTNSKGYTKITIKTAPDTLINAQKGIFIPEKTEASADTNASKPAPAPQPVQKYEYNEETPVQYNQPIRSRSGVDQTNPVDIKTSVKQFEPSKPAEQKLQTVSEPPSNPPAPAAPQESDSSEVILILMSIVLMITVITFIYIKSKNKLAEILGEQPEIDISDESKKQEEKKSKEIKKAIKKLDKMYTKPVKMPVDMLSEPQKLPSKPVEPVDDNIIVDLDELFQEKSKTGTESTPNFEEENSALDDFLNGFSFLDEPADEAQEETFNEELYEKYINDDNLKFSQDDIARMEKLLNIEISDDTLKHISEFAVTVPIAEKRPSHTEILENFVTSYAVHQNITFSKSDVEALYKLISVEIDSSFITDLKTNPERQIEMRAQMEKQKAKPHKTSELLTLNVKDMLPDLADALKKQGRKRIESEYKPQTVYYSEGYEVSTLSLNEELPDLTIEINNKDAYTTRPSDDIEYAEAGYDFDKLSIDNELPDLNDMLANPDKYNSAKNQPVEVDEDALLNNISNVTFKPFYDGVEEFEVLNKFDNADIPSVDDVQEEFNQFDGFEVVNDVQAEENNTETEVEVQDDFEALFDDNYVDLDTPEKSAPAPEKLELSSSQDDAEKLLQLIQEQREERKVKEAKAAEEPVNVKTIAPAVAVKEQYSGRGINKPVMQDTQDDEIIKICVIDNEKFDVIARAKFTEQIGCYLARNEKGYTIIGYTGTSMFKIKHYERLKSDKIQSRVSEKLDDGTIRYIVRIGIHKFILNVSDENLEYVMDLC